MLHATLTPNDSGLPEPWGFGTTNAGLNIRPAWDKATGTGVVGAFIDTGITSHPGSQRERAAGLRLHQRCGACAQQQRP